MEFQASKNQLHRIERLQKALRIASAICGLSEQQAELLIAKLEDLNGILKISWIHPPSPLQRTAFSLAWVECKETADRVEHLY